MGKILESDPDNKLIINRYADSLRGLGNYDKALECFNKILASGDDYFALLGKAAALRLIGDLEKAEEIYLGLLSKSPSDPRPALELSDLWDIMGKKPEAIKLLEDLAKKNPSNESIRERIEYLKD